MTSTVLPSINPLCRRPVVEQAMGKTRSTLYRDIKKGVLTKPVSIGGDRVAWPANEIQAINQARIAGKSDDEIMALVIELELLRTGIDDSSEKHPVANPANSANPTNSNTAQKTEPKSPWSAAIGGGQ